MAVYDTFIWAKCAAILVLLGLIMICQYDFALPHKLAGLFNLSIGDDEYDNMIQPRKPKRIVLWNMYPRAFFWSYPVPTGERSLISCAPKQQCYFIDSHASHMEPHKHPENYDALVFNAFTKFTIPKVRLPHQVYVMHMFEPQSIASWLPGWVKGDKFYNWTVSFLSNSDIVARHRIMGKYHKPNYKSIDSLPQLGYNRINGSAMVLWIVSNCGVEHRDVYVKELQKYISVDIRGKCGKQACSWEKGKNRYNNEDCFQTLSKSGQYKFYLAFENSLCREYISLKPFRALNSSLVPIVYGGASPEYYKSILPQNSYLDVRNFDSPKLLADYLYYLDKNDSAYKSYLLWRTEYWINPIIEPWYCDLCNALYNTTKMSQSKNINWGHFFTTEDCFATVPISNTSIISESLLKKCDVPMISKDQRIC